MNSIDQDPGAIIPPNITKMSDEAKRRVLKRFTQQFIQRYINLPLLTAQGCKSRQPRPAEYDGVFEYAREVLTLSMLYAVFQDVICEGDGMRVLSCWKFFLLIFKSAKRKNYAIEALNLLLQYHLRLPDRLAQQLI